MIKSSAVEFHETFQPEFVYISKLLKLAADEFSGTKFEISEQSGIPTGKQKGKVEPHIKYAKYMGLINYTYDKGVYSLSLSKLGNEVYIQDPYLHEELTCWLCHYGMVRKEYGAPQWAFLVHDSYPGVNEAISQERLFSNAMLWCDISRENLLKKVFSVVRSSYTDGCFEPLRFLEWSDSVKFFEESERFDLLYVYAYALLDSWEALLPDKNEITDLEIKSSLGFNKIFGLNEDECNYVIDSLAFEGIITVNRQLFPPTIIRTSSAADIIQQLYSRLL